jgi:hypothetical protein
MLLNCVMPGKISYIVGDFNTGTPQRIKVLKDEITKMKFKMLVSEPTHESGNTLDNLITNDLIPENCNVFLYPTYYTDHDIICFTIRN